MARPSILEARERKRQSTDIAAAAPANPGAAKRAAVSRDGKVNVSAYFPPEVKASLRLVQAKRGGQIQDLLAEALNLLFAKYRVPESAPVETPPLKGSEE